MSIGTGVSAETGIFDKVRWGTHLCYISSSHDELIKLMTSYFMTGLERNALCLWLSSEPVGRLVMDKLMDSVPHLEQYRRKGQIAAVAHTDWYMRDGRLDVTAAVHHASEALARARARGLDGVWVAGELSWVGETERAAVLAYEEMVCQFISGLPVVALCAYPAAGLGIPETLGLFRTHQGIVIRRGAQWEIVESLEQAKSEKALRETERSYQHLFETTLDGIEVIDAATGRILIANQAAARIFGFSSPEEMVGVNPLDYLPAETRGHVAQLMAESMFEKDLHQVLELKALRKDGREVWISAVGVRTEYQGRLAGLVSMRDITEQRRTESALQESRRDLQAVFDSVRDGIAVFDLSGTLMRVNRRILEVGGYSADEIIGRSFRELDMFPAKDIAKMESAFAPLLSGMDAPPLELEVTTKPGQKLILEVRVSPLKMRGDVVGSIAVVRDITERKRTQEELQRREQEFRALAENATDVVARYDRAKRHLYINRAVERLTGIPRSEFIGKTNGELGAPKELVRLWEEAGEAVFVTGQERVIEYEMPTVSGHGHFEAHLTPEFGPDGSVQSVLVVSREITDRKHAEEALSESEKRYRLLAENVTDVIWVTDVNLHPVYVSPSIERLLGYRAEESRFRGLDDALDPSSARKVRDILAELMADEGVGRGGSRDLRGAVELGLRRRDGTTVWVDTTVTVMRDLSGHPVQFLGVLRDVTEKKRAEEQVHQSYEKLERALEGTIQAIRAMVDMRDRYTAGHQLRVTELACAIAEAMGLPAEQVQGVHVAGLLHDVGKMLLPTELLTKPGRLNDIEFAMVRTHAKAGYSILKSIDFPWPIAKTVLQHHERMDGSGYPDGIRGEDILIEARILAVADVVEAMSSHRPYRPALGLDKALEEIIKNKGVLYDPQVVDACVRVFKEQAFSFKGEAVAEPY
ncbi:MAG: PAS domain S-box protein [Dehalococcoidia bacterium]|nr:PAS domain S-box protein [Dehalococcoidia bacterium]